MSTSWFRGVISKDGDTTGPPMVVYQRGIQDLSSDIARAQERIDMALANLEQARDELRRAQQAFIEYCAEIGLSLEITPTLYPEKRYVLED